MAQALESCGLEFNSQLFRSFLAQPPGEIYLTSLSLSFLICKMETMVLLLSSSHCEDLRLIQIAWHIVSAQHVILIETEAFPLYTGGCMLSFKRDPDAFLEGQSWLRSLLTPCPCLLQSHPSVTTCNLPQLCPAPPSQVPSCTCHLLPETRCP